MLSFVDFFQRKKKVLKSLGFRKNSNFLFEAPALPWMIFVLLFKGNYISARVHIHNGRPIKA